MDNILTPKEIVAQLDNYIIGQDDAKKLLRLHCTIVIAVCKSQRSYNKKLLQRT